MAPPRKRIHIEVEKPQNPEFALNNPIPTATSGPSTASTSHITPPATQAAIPAYPDEPADPLNASEDATLQNNDDSAANLLDINKKNANFYLLQWLTLSSNSYLNAEYDYDAPPRVSSCGACDTPTPAFYRCTSCLGNIHYCRKCLMKAHEFTPTHRTETWGGTHWQDVSLASLGFVLHLGHGGRQCKEKGPTSPILVGDLNGFTEVQVRYCYHPDSPTKAEQLLSAGLFPCSDVAPRSAFTKVLLTVFNIFSTLGSTSAHRFYLVLERMTNPGFPDDVDDRYRELLSTYQKFLHISNLKRSGENYYSHPDEAHPGDQALDCLACPRPGLNFRWDEVKDDKQNWFRVHVSYDGNFRSVRKAKKVDSGDLCFSDGKAYFLEKGPYQKWVNEPHAPQRTQKPSCDHHKAAKANSVQKAGRDITGVGAFTCTSHSCFIPRGMVDFTGGEKFIFCDWSFAQIVRYLYGYGRSVLQMTYDIWCHWFINWMTRKFNLPPNLLVPEDLDFNGAIPKWHMVGHELNCHVRYALDFMRYVGRLEGEGPERVWAHMNQHAGSTSEQGPGTRTDNINNMAFEWNFKKMIRFHILLPPRFWEAKRMFETMKNKHEVLTTAFPPLTIEKWESESLEPKKAANGNWESPMFDSITNNGSFQLKIQEARKEESPSTRIAGRKPGATRWVSEGIELEHSVQNLKEDTKGLGSHPTPQQAESINRQRISLRDRIVNHQKRRIFYMSGLDDPDNPDYSPLEDEDIEDIEVRLLLSYNSETLQYAGLSTLAELELELRRGMCSDALESTRQLIGAKHLAIKNKQHHERGQVATTRSEAVIRRHSDKVNKARWRYNNSRAAMLRLGPSDLDLRQYLPLTDTDLTPLQSYLDETARGTGQGYKTGPSWIWCNSGVPHTDDWIVEALKPEWFCGRERMRRWEEQIVHQQNWIFPESLFKIFQDPKDAQDAKYGYPLFKIFHTMENSPHKFQELEPLY
ncbi:hypothetical protein RhiJN_22630 [Ceratobasidium sp. AG-Ba]|nr:hypothetical protein RhiJN_22630 [Ceratobasidium sp. AG-Ba]